MIPFLNGLPEAVEKVHELSNTRNQVVEITIITVYELLKGASLSSKPQENLKHVKKVISNLQVLDLSPEACEEASSIFCELKKSGRMISEFDILIAAIAKPSWNTPPWANTRSTSWPWTTRTSGPSRRIARSISSTRPTCARCAT